MMRRLFVPLAGALLLAAPASAQTLEATIARFYADTADWAVHDDMDVLEEREPENLEVLAWAAEFDLRLSPERAALTAYLVLDRAPCNAMAHNVIAVAHLRSEEASRVDSAWTHAARAAECGPEDGNAWLTYWDAATMRGDADGERRAQQRLGEIRFFSPPVLEFARWTLNAAPRDAVLLTSGDDEFYPLQVVQTALNVRTDVIIVRTTHLNVPAYARRLSETAMYPVPPEAVGTDEGTPVHRDGPSALQQAVVRAWVDAHLAGGHKPLALTALTNLEFAGNHSWGLLRRAGPVVTVHPRGRLSDPLYAPEAYEAAWRDLDLRRLDGPLTTEGDRSPVRRTTLHPAEIIVLLYAAYADYQGGHDQRQIARQALGWAEQVMATGRPRADFREFLDQARRAIP